MSIELEVGKRYIVKRGYETPSKIKVVDSTKTCYELEWNGGNKMLIEKKEFNAWYNIIEELGGQSIFEMLQNKD